ncbi:hypothetical protein Q9189_007064 [Teloschistes chrysophthalmus]
MRFLYFSLIISASYLHVHGSPSLPESIQLNGAHSAEKVPRAPPELPPKPSTSGPGSFHGSQFAFLEETDFAPAVDAMPVWMFSTTQKEFGPCYPEGATNTTGNGPNPGTNVGISASPGEDCMDPGVPTTGPYTLSNPFPTYVGAMWCENVKEWRVQFYNYYVHDGILSGFGHKHDWEGVVVKWKQDPEGDWWHRAGAIYNKHCMHDHYSWDQLNTVHVDVPGTTDVRDERQGLNREHPKVYVGFFSHASFPEISKVRKTIFNGRCPEERKLLGDEYR